MALKTLLSVTFHVVAPNCNVFGMFHFGFDINAGADQLREDFLFSITILLAEYIRDILDQ